ncbi:2OG-Fe dioxygenase family protein [Roseobacter cerasinus]|nr:2OG-Fe dioxygenase family protein [Roseobacter cerasinus]
MNDQVAGELAAQGYSYIAAPDFGVPNATDSDFARLADEWNRLETDNYLQENATFRERRFGRFAYQPSTQTVVQLKHTPYFQAAGTNTYAGGIHRVVAPLTEQFAKDPLLSDLIKQDFDCFPTRSFDKSEWWYVACHLFRIIGRDGEEGEPTPEGVHRDDINYGAMHLMDRVNATGGLSRIHAEDHSIAAELCLKNRLDTLFWADEQVLHSVTPIRPSDTQRSAVRDILILGYTHSPNILEEEGTS